MSCRINRGQEWGIRLMHELSYHESSIFLTLTYNDDHVPKDWGLRPSHLQLFFKRLRAEGLAFKYYACGEYGEEFRRPHYHAIVFGLGKKDEDLIGECWGLGFVSVGYVSQQSINYVTSYVNKKLYGKLAKDHYGKLIAPFARMSKGLGLSWLKENEDQVLLHQGVRQRGKTVRAPRYYFKHLDAIEVEMANALTLLKADEKASRRALLGIEGVSVTQRVIESRAQVEADLKAKQGMEKRGNL